MNIKELLIYGKNELLNKEDSLYLAKLLLKDLLNKDSNYIVIHSNEIINNEIELQFKEKIKLLNKGIPIQYLINKQEFMGLNFYVDKNVLIPQPDTECLVEEILKNYDNNNQYAILDLCTGSGAIGISLANKLEKSNIYFSDISKKALEIAEKNAISNNVSNRCNFILSNMFENVNFKFDIIVSNPPYIETDVINNLSIEVRNEPIIALDGGSDGLKFYKIIANNAYKYLNKDGMLALEIGYNQKLDVIEILEKTNKYTNIYSVKDYGNNDRVIIAYLK